MKDVFEMSIRPVLTIIHALLLCAATLGAISLGLGRGAGGIAQAGGPGPSLVRDALLQQLTDTSVIVRFRTDDSAVGTPFVEFGTDPFEGGPGISTQVVNGTSNAPGSGPGQRDHTVSLTGLSPQQTYYYRFGIVGEGVIGGGCAHHRFTTAAPVGSTAPFSAWLVGDSGTGYAPQRAVRDAMLAHLGGDAPDLFLHAGDIAYDNGTDLEFTENVFAIYAEVFAQSSFWPTIGNHDADSATSILGVGPYFDAFTLPTQGELGGVPSGTEAYYSFDHHNVHFIVIDTAEGDLLPPSTMFDWIVADLQGTFADWVVALLHHPPYSKGSHDSDDGTDSGGRLVLAREFLLPLLEAGGVDLVLSGHSHGYERSHLIDGAWGYGGIPNYATPDTATLVTDGRILDLGDGDPYGDGAYTKAPGSMSPGEVCVVAGHGGRAIYGNGGHPVMAAEEFEFGSCLLSVDGDLLWLENLRADGAITDRVAISKGARIHRIVTSIEGVGSIARDADRPLYATGESVTLTAVPAPGWSFVEWSGAASGSDPVLTTTISADLAVTARFAPAEPKVFIAYNDLGWVPGQTSDDVTTITSPNGGSGLPSSGELVDRATGLATGATLTVTGGFFDPAVSAISESASPVPGNDAWVAFHAPLDAHGSIGPSPFPAPPEDLLLAVTGLDPALHHTVTVYGNRGALGWDEATSVTIEGAVSFRNESSVATDNPAPGLWGALFTGVDDPTTRLPAGNAQGYVARFAAVESGSDGTIVLRLSPDGEISSPPFAIYANALALSAEVPPVSFVRGDVDGSGDLDLGDPIALLLDRFAGDPAPCLEAADFDASGAVDLPDAIGLLLYLFSSGPPPASPFPACGAFLGELGCGDPGDC